MHVFHQQEDLIAKWPISKLFIYAKMAAGLTNKEFN